MNVHAGATIGYGAGVTDPASFLKGRTRETKIRRDARGRWFNDDVEITHVLLTKAFDRWLERAPDGSGRWCLSNRINWAFVEVDGPGRFVRRFDASTMTMTLSDDSVQRLDPTSLWQASDGSLSCALANGMTARFDRAAMMDLAGVLDEDDDGVFLTFGDLQVRPPAREAS